MLEEILNQVQDDGKKGAVWYSGRMKLVITEDEKWPLRRVAIEVDREKLFELLDMMSKEREPKFEKIVFSGGVGVRQNWGGGVETVEIGDRRLSGGVVLGFFAPRKAEVRLYPEAMVAVTAGKYRGQMSGREVVERAREEFYRMMLEELEHGFQDGGQRAYVPFLAKVVAWSSPLIPVYVIGSVIWVVSSGRSLWWGVAILLGLLAWVFVPVWMSWLPKPGWWVRTKYNWSRREADAKAVTWSIKLFRKAREAVVMKIA